ncbi:MAG: hypothetical protein M1817_001425 [Caeruleum heppii]|nr:MAG: hypothetical protein M1817_001425 [Caeruleum heppii]
MCNLVRTQHTCGHFRHLTLLTCKVDGRGQRRSWWWRVTFGAAEKTGRTGPRGCVMTRETKPYNRRCPDCEAELDPEPFNEEAWEKGLEETCEKLVVKQGNKGVYIYEATGRWVTVYRPEWADSDFDDDEEEEEEEDKK